MENRDMASRMNQGLWNIIRKRQQSPVGKGFVAVLHASGLVKLWHFMMYKKDQRHPTQQMNDSAEFIKANQERISHVL